MDKSQSNSFYEGSAEKNNLLTHNNYSFRLPRTWEKSRRAVRSISLVLSIEKSPRERWRSQADTPPCASPYRSEFSSGAACCCRGITASCLGAAALLRLALCLAAPSNGLFSNTPFCPEGAGGDAETAAINPAQWRLHHSLQASHWNHISTARRACLASKFCKRIKKLVAHLQTASLSSKTGPAHPK